MDSLGVPHNVKQQIIKLVPASIASRISCFVFYDNHPCDDRALDITVCTSNGDIYQIFQRNIIASISLDHCNKPSEIVAQRNSRNELFFILKASDTLFILSSKPKFCIHQKLNNIERYIFEDSEGFGVVNLKVVCLDDAVPILLDENFNIVVDKFNASNQENKDDVAIHPQLKNKLIEAQFNLINNERKLKEIKNLRQEAAFALYQSFHPNFEKPALCADTQKFAGSLQINTKSVWIKSCNKKIVVCMEIFNRSDVSIEDIHILLHGFSDSTLTYTSKVFESIPNAPFWKETAQIIPSDSNRILALVIEVSELLAICQKIELDGIIVYEMNKEFKFIPFDKVAVSALSFMHESFDALSKGNLDKEEILAVIATTHKTDVIIRLTSKEDYSYNIIDGMMEYLNMHKVYNLDNLLLHSLSPYHVLNGVMLHLVDNVADGVYKAELYVRCPSQIVSLIHLIHDAIPKQILVTTPDIKVTPKYSQEYIWNPPTSKDNVIDNIKEYSYSIIKQMSIIIEKYDDCMMKMNREGNAGERIGREIDLLAGGDEEFAQFKSKILSEIEKSVKSLLKKPPDVVHSEDMIIDSDE